MTSDVPPTSPRERLAELVACCRKRATRAGEKYAAAGDEKVAAENALCAAAARLAQWDAENPDPQGSIFEDLTDV